MGVPATLQPDGALRRPAHTGPSLAKPPEGPQSPNCTRPPRWVQKNNNNKKHTREEGKKRQSSSQAYPRQDCHHAFQRPRHQSKSSLLPPTSAQKPSTLKTHSREEIQYDLWVEEKSKRGQDTKQFTEKDGTFSSEEHFRHMHIQVWRALQTEPDDIYLGADHIPLQKQTLICWHSGRKSFRVII